MLVFCVCSADRVRTIHKWKNIIKFTINCGADLWIMILDAVEEIVEIFFYL